MGEHHEAERFDSIVVPIDLEADGDRALRHAACLAALGDVPLDLVLVSSGSDLAVDVAELDGRVAALTTSTARWTIVRDSEPGETLADLLDRRPDALVVMATHARNRFLARLTGSVSDELVHLTRHPLLMIGPHVRAGHQPWDPTLVVGLDGEGVGEGALGAVRTWSRTFGGKPPWLVQVVGALAGPPAAPEGDVLESTYLHRVATNLAREGVEAEWEVLRSGSPVGALTEFADRLGEQGTDPILVVASEHWTGAAAHGSSTARALTHEARHPVLVVPRSSNGRER